VEGISEQAEAGEGSQAGLDCGDSIDVADLVLG
jgi:hypothetical protein